MPHSSPDILSTLFSPFPSVSLRKNNNKNKREASRNTPTAPAHLPPCLPTLTTHFFFTMAPPTSSSSGNPRDRTSEFRQCYQSIANRSNTTAASSKASKGKGAAAGGGAQSKSEIARLAGGIARDINATTGKLQKLAQRESKRLCWLKGEEGEGRGRDGGREVRKGR